MSGASILLTNLTATTLSVDTRFGKFSDKVLRVSLSPAGTPKSSYDVGAIASLAALNANAQIRQLLDSTPPKVTLSVVRGTADIPGAIDAVADSIGEAAAFRRVYAVAAGAGGAADDVPLYVGSFPFAAQICDAQFMCSTAVATSTVQLRDAISGGGAGHSMQFNTSTTGRKRDDGTGVAPSAGTVTTVAKNGSLYLHRSDSGIAGTIIIDYQRLS